MRPIKSHWIVLALVGALGLMAAMPVMAGTTPVIQGGSFITFTHTDDLLSGSQITNQTELNGVGAGVGEIPSSPPASFQMNDPINVSSSSTLADAGAYSTTTLTEMAIGLKTGTGVNQTNNGAFTGASELDISITASWTLGSSGFPSSGHPPAVTYSFAVSGIVGTGGSAEFNVNLQFFDLSSTFLDAPIGSVTSNNTYGPGNFNKVVSGSAEIDSGVPLPAGSTLTMTGTIDFLTLDPGSPSSIGISPGQVNAAAIVPVEDENLGVTTPLPSSWEMGLVGMSLAACATVLRKRRLA
jgi:hypothetical protein